MTEEERIAALEEDMEKLRKLLLEPPTDGGITTAQWIAKTRKTVEAGKIGGRFIMGLLGLVALSGAAWAATKGWFAE